MIFNSIDFALFLPIVFVLYWFVTNKNLKLQNFLIVAASYVFYGWWDYRFLSLILFSTLLDYSLGILIFRNRKQTGKKRLLWLSVAVNLGFLGFFKYFNFFLDSFTTAFTFFGVEISTGSLNIILPVGISFYTFQSLSYCIDVYRGKLQPTTDLLAFTAFVCFFPQLVAGPIERAANLLPQFCQKRVFDYLKARDGLRQILWGFFKKIVIADSCAPLVNQIFDNYSIHSGSTLLLGVVLFAIQIYCDFSGYSDIAIGTSRLFGFHLRQNFAFPYFAVSIPEFWKRWHISLTSWFRDYVYIPLGGSKMGKSSQLRNVCIVFVLSGFWHGANWTFIVWGAIHALLFIPFIFINKDKGGLSELKPSAFLPGFKEFFQILLTFSLTTLAWIFFRASNLEQAWGYVCGIFSPTVFNVPVFRPLGLFVFTGILVLAEWISKDRQHALEFLELRLKTVPRFIVYIILTFTTLFHHRFHEESEFIYFQF